jgi:hypothetical protein
MRVVTQDMDIPEDIVWLRERFTDWNFGTMWTTVSSGPDHRRIWASRNGVLLSADTAIALVGKIEREPAV